MSEREPNPPVDPSGIEEPHDVLAAEEFGIGTRDERFPPDPTGIQEPHDVLAAEEFAMPAATVAYDDGGPPRVWLPVIALLGAIAAAAIVARRRR
jgi:MYXO-CTERM domain-containing protein